MYPDIAPFCIGPFLEFARISPIWNSRTFPEFSGCGRATIPANRVLRVPWDTGAPTATSLPRVTARGIAGVLGHLPQTVLEVDLLLAADGDAGEQVVDQALEHVQVGGHDLWQVEVPQGPQEEVLLRQLRLGALQRAGDHEQGLDGPQAPVVVVLLGQEVLAEAEQGDELLGEEPRLQEP